MLIDLMSTNIRLILILKSQILKVYACEIKVKEHHKIHKTKLKSALIICFQLLG